MRACARPSSLLWLCAALMTQAACLSTFDADSVELAEPDERDAAPDAEQDAQDAGPDDDAQDAPDDASDLGPDADDAQDATNDADLGPDAEQDAPDDADAEPDLPTECAQDGQECAPPLAGAKGICQDGVCALAGCQEGLGDCNQDLEQEGSDGCEAALDQISRCGACDRACEGGAAQWSCELGLCTVAACDEGFLDVNLDPADGCEAQQPPAYAVASVLPLNHGAKFGWEATTTGATAARLELAWGPEQGPTRTRWFDLTQGQANGVAGPIEQGEGQVVRVRAWSDQGVPGPWSGPLSFDFQPAGWFQRSLSPFVVSSSFEDAQTGLLLGRSLVGHLVRGGREYLPGRPADPTGLLYGHLQTQGPAAGLGVHIGADGSCEVTRDFGVTWARSFLPTSGQLHFGYATEEGDLLVGGEEGLLVSYDQGQSWSIDERIQNPFDPWYAAAPIPGDPTAVALTSANANGTTVTFWRREQVSPGLVVQTTTGPIPFWISMLNAQEGWMALSSELRRTSDGWSSSEPVALPDAEGAFFFRVVFEPTGQRGVVLAFGGPMWWTEDGGASWVRVELPIVPENDGWGAVSYLGDALPPAFVLVSSVGHRVLWQEGPSGWELQELQASVQGDFVGVQASSQLTSMYFLTQDGRLVQSRSVPENVQSVGQLPGILANWNALALGSDGLRLAVGGGNGARLVTREAIAREWTEQTLPGAPPRDLVLRDATLGDVRAGGWVVGDNPNGGFVYRVATSPALRITQVGGSTVDRLNSLAGTSLRSVVSSRVGDKHAILGMRAEPLLFLGSGVGSVTWDTVPLPTSQRVERAGFQPDTEQLWLVGEGGMVFSVNTTNKVVVRRDLPPLPGAPYEVGSLRLTDVAFADASRGWIVSAEGWLAWTVDGGESWTWERVVDASERGSVALRRLLVDPEGQHALVVGDGGRVLWTANGGQP